MASKGQRATIRSAEVKVHTQSNLVGTLLLLTHAGTLVQGKEIGSS